MMTFFRVAGVRAVVVHLAAFAALAAAPAAAQVTATSPVPLIGTVREGRLPNGLSYFIRANSRPQGRAELRLVVNAGSVLEDDDQLGAAHYIEHMSFNGTTRFPKNELVSYLQSVGVRLGGDLNANTGYDETIYILPLPVGDKAVFENGLAILREWAGNALLTDADIDGERNVVLAELRSGAAAEERVRRQTLPRMFNGSRYAERLPIGTERSLREMKADALRRFYRDWYRPDLQAVIVVGDINPDEVERSIKALFSDLKAPERPRARPSHFDIAPRTSLDSLVVSDRELAAGRIDITEYVRPQAPLDTVGAYDALLKDQLVNRMMAMRLYELTDQPSRPFLAAQALRTPIVRGHEAFVASAAIAGQDALETTRVLFTELERARRFGFTAEELDVAKREVLNNYAQAAAEGDKAESASLADELGRHFLTGEPVPGIAWEFGRVKEVVPGLTLDEVNAHAAMVLAEPGSQPFVMFAGPTAGRASEDALRTAIAEVRQASIAPYRGIKVDTALLEREPAAGALASEKTDAALGTTTLTFANGVTVVLRPTDFKNDEVMLSAGRYGGQFLYDLADHQNAVHLPRTIEAMGFGSMTPIALQRYIGTHTANASMDFGPYSEEIDGASTRDDVTTLLQLVYLKMTSPRLDPERFESSRRALKGYLAGLSNSPDKQFEDFTMAVLSKEHPRAPRVPTPSDLDKIDPQRSVAIWKERFGNAAGMTFVLAGSFDVAEVKPLVAKYLGGLPGSPRESRFRDVGLRYPTSPVTRTLHKGADNSALTIIYTGQRAWTAKDALSLDALTEVLRFRTIDRIREELGTTYSPGVVSDFSRIPAGEYALRFWIACSPDEAPRVDAAIGQILSGLKAKGPTAGELEKVRRTWLNEHEARTRTNEYWADRLRDRAIDPRAEEAESTYVARVNALTAADVTEAARSFVDEAHRVRLLLEPEPFGLGR
jgi:zinc protease